MDYLKELKKFLAEPPHEEDFPNQNNEYRRQRIVELAVQAADEIIMEGSDGSVEETDFLTARFTMEFMKKTLNISASKLLSADLRKSVPAPLPEPRIMPVTVSRLKRYRGKKNWGLSIDAVHQCDRYIEMGFRPVLKFCEMDDLLNPLFEMPWCGSEKLKSTGLVLIEPLGEGNKPFYLLPIGMWFYDNAMGVRYVSRGSPQAETT